MVRAIGIFIIGMVYQSNALATDYEFIWNPYCPYTCDAKLENGKEGVAIEIIRAVFKDSEHTVSFKRIDSWLRAKRLVKSGMSDGMAFTFYQHDKTENGYLTPETPMLMVKGIAYLSLPKNQMTPFRVTDVARFNAIGNYYGAVNSNRRLARYLAENPHKTIYVTGSNILKRVREMLDIGRIEIWLDSPDLLNYMVTKYPQYAVSTSPTGNAEYAGMLFDESKPQSKALAKMMDEGIVKLRKSGELEKILARYGMSDRMAKTVK